MLPKVVRICFNRIRNIDRLAFKIILSLIIRRKYSSIFSSPAVRKENVHNFAKRIILCTWLHIIRYATNIDTYMSYKSWQHGARNEVIFTFLRMADSRELLQKSNCAFISRNVSTWRPGITITKLSIIFMNAIKSFF